MRNCVVRLLPLLLAVMVWRPAWSWDPHGHELVGAVADRLLTPNARAHVRDILGYNLETAAKWADCVRSVDRLPDGTFRYDSTTQYQRWCEGFMAPAEVARMEDYARRNWSNCQGIGHGCHETYHFADVAFQRGAYSRSFTGTSDHDVVAAIEAAIDVLEGKPALPLFSIVDKKEALLMLAHFVGDLHQPLHVGAIYLDANGAEVDPDRPGVNAKETSTKGGNGIKSGDVNLHEMWDEVPETWTLESRPQVLAMAKGVPAASGPLAAWPPTWASETVKGTSDAFRGLTYGAKHDGTWPMTFADKPAYEAEETRIKERQIARAGARLAAILDALWP